MSIVSVHHASIGAERSVDVFAPDAAHMQTYYSELRLHSLLIMFSMLGAMIRVELEATSEYDL